MLKICSIFWSWQNFDLFCCRFATRRRQLRALSPFCQWGGALLSLTLILGWYTNHFVSSLNLYHQEIYIFFKTFTLAELNSLPLTNNNTLEIGRKDISLDNIKEYDTIKKIIWRYIKPMQIFHMVKRSNMLKRMRSVIQFFCAL